MAGVLRFRLLLCCRRDRGGTKAARRTPGLHAGPLQSGWQKLDKWVVSPRKNGFGK